MEEVAKQHSKTPIIDNIVNDDLENFIVPTDSKTTKKGKRSSILKQPSASLSSDIDVDCHRDSLKAPRRVSFAKTFQVLEFQCHPDSVTVKNVGESKDHNYISSTGFNDKVPLEENQHSGTTLVKQAVFGNSVSTDCVTQNRKSNKPYMTRKRKSGDILPPVEVKITKNSLLSDITNTSVLHSATTKSCTVPPNMEIFNPEFLKTYSNDDFIDETDVGTNYNIPSIFSSAELLETSPDISLPDISQKADVDDVNMDITCVSVASFHPKCINLPERPNLDKTLKNDSVFLPHKEYDFEENAKVDQILVKLNVNLNSGPKVITEMFVDGKFAPVGDSLKIERQNHKLNSTKIFNETMFMDDSDLTTSVMLNAEDDDKTNCLPVNMELTEVISVHDRKSREEITEVKGNIPKPIEIGEKFVILRGSKITNETMCSVESVQTRDIHDQTNMKNNMTEHFNVDMELTLGNLTFSSEDPLAVEHLNAADDLGIGVNGQDSSQTKVSDVDMELTLSTKCTTGSKQLNILDCECEGESLVQSNLNIIATPSSNSVYSKSVDDNTVSVLMPVERKTMECYSDDVNMLQNCAGKTKLFNEAMELTQANLEHVAKPGSKTFQPVNSPFESVSICIDKTRLFYDQMDFTFVNAATESESSDFNLENEAIPTLNNAEVSPANACKNSIPTKSVDTITQEHEGNEAPKISEMIQGQDFVVSSSLTGVDKCLTIDDSSIADGTGEDKLLPHHNKTEVFSDDDMNVTVANCIETKQTSEFIKKSQETALGLPNLDTLPAPTLVSAQKYSIKETSDFSKQAKRTPDSFTDDMLHSGEDKTKVFNNDDMEMTLLDLTCVTEKDMPTSKSLYSSGKHMANNPLKKHKANSSRKDLDWACSTDEERTPVSDSINELQIEFFPDKTKTFVLPDVSELIILQPDTFCNKQIDGTLTQNLEKLQPCMPYGQSQVNSKAVDASKISTSVSRKIGKGQLNIANEMEQSSSTLNSTSNANILYRIEQLKNRHYHCVPNVTNKPILPPHFEKDVVPVFKMTTNTEFRIPDKKTELPKRDTVPKSGIDPVKISLTAKQKRDEPEPMQVTGKIVQPVDCTFAKVDIMEPSDPKENNAHSISLHNYSNLSMDSLQLISDSMLDNNSLLPEMHCLGSQNMVQAEEELSEHEFSMGYKQLSLAPNVQSTLQQVEPLKEYILVQDKIKNEENMPLCDVKVPELSNKSMDFMPCYIKDQDPIAIEVEEPQIECVATLSVQHDNSSDSLNCSTVKDSCSSIEDKPTCKCIAESASPVKIADSPCKSRCLELTEETIDVKVTEVKDQSLKDEIPTLSAPPRNLSLPQRKSIGIQFDENQTAKTSPAKIPESSKPQENSKSTPLLKSVGIQCEGLTPEMEIESPEEDKNGSLMMSSGVQCKIFTPIKVSETSYTSGEVDFSILPCKANPSPNIVNANEVTKDQGTSLNSCPNEDATILQEVIDEGDQKIRRELFALEADDKMTEPSDDVDMPSVKADNKANVEYCTDTSLQKDLPTESAENLTDTEDHIEEVVTVEDILEVVKSSIRKYSNLKIVEVSEEFMKVSAIQDTLYITIRFSDTQTPIKGMTLSYDSELTRYDYQLLNAVHKHFHVVLRINGLITECRISSDILKLLDQLSVASEEALKLFVDIEIVGLRHKYHFLPGGELSVRINNWNLGSIFWLVFPMGDDMIYPSEPIIPFIEKIEFGEPVSKEVIQDRLKTVEPGPKYLMRLVHKAEKTS